VTLNWLSKKKIEFVSSSIYVKEKNLHVYQNLIVHEVRDEIYDDQHNLISNEIIEEHEEIIEWEYSFAEYCRFNFLNKYEITEMVDVALSCFNWKTDVIFGIHDLVERINKDLGPFYEDLAHTEIQDFINNVYDESIEIIKSDPESTNSELFSIKRDLVEMLKMELQEININKLQKAKYCTVHRQKLKFNLTLETFSALIKVLESGKILFEERKDILDFAEKHFMYFPQGSEEFINITEDRLKRAMDDHGTPQHTGKGLDKIYEKITNTIATIQKPGK
jgi:hypothetical protein